MSSRKSKKSRKSLTIAVVLALAVSIVPAAVLAEKGGHPGRGHGNPHKARADDLRGDSGRGGVDFRFAAGDRAQVVDYYGIQAGSGHCPPGLAKKNNGCRPPGQARKWATGRPLPRDVVYYELPGDLLLRLPPPPQGHRYVRVAGDILMIAVGTSMVVDAIQDIFR